ncbi:MAG TPA: hypothetical protein PLN52_12720, partial [Opitutaceae bacterium]|nr:hypothetical protein [Opitutaceae bacterium]
MLVHKLVLPETMAGSAFIGI